MEDAKKKNNKKRLLIIIIIIAAAAAALLAGRYVSQRKQINSIMPTVQTDQVSRKTLTSSIAATGTIKSKVVTNVTAGGISESGLKVTGVNVQVGDAVSEGDILCTFDVSNAKEQMADVKDAQAKAEAQEAAGIKSAQRAYDQAVSSKESSLSAAQAEIDAAEAEVNSAKTALEAYPDNVDQARRDAEEAKAALDAADAAVEALENDPNAKPEEIKAAKEEAKTAEAALDTADQVLEELTDPKYEQTLKESVNTAEAAYRQATASYQQTSDAADESIAAAKDSLDNAKLNSGSGMDSSTKAQIRSLQETVDGESLKSPVTGTVTAVNVTEDGYYTGGVVVTIQDTENLYVEASIKESDIADVKEGMEVLVKTDATGDEELKGKVTNVAPTSGTGASIPADATETMLSSGSTQSGTGYLVEIDLLSANERLRIDMTAKLSLIKEQKKNILVVPYDAIFTDENGNKTLHVISGPEEAEGLSAEPESAGDGSMEEYKEVQIQTGMESGYYVEVLPTPGIENGTVIQMPAADENSLDEMDPAGGLG